MPYTLAGAKVWDGAAWVAAAGNGGLLETPALRWSTPSDVAVTANATAHTYGAWTELVASTASDSDLLVLCTSTASSGQASATLISVAIGAASSEVAIVSDVAIGSHYLWCIPLPVSIPAGSRVSARIQSVVTGGKVAEVLAYGFAAGIVNPPTSLVTFGTSTATSRGTQSAGTNTWTQMTASTAQAFRNLVIVPSFSSSSTSAAELVVDLGTGASSSEVVVATVHAKRENWESLLHRGLPTAAIGGAVPSGTRIACRADSSSLDFTVLGVPE